MIQQQTINLTEYSQSMYDAGFFTGFMSVAQPIQQLLSVGLQENKDYIELLIAIANVIEKSTPKMTAKECTENLNKYNNIILNQSVTVSVTKGEEDK